MEVGVTDEGSEFPSTSGARLYVSGDPEWNRRLLGMVASLLLETDFDMGVFTLCLPDGSKHPWAWALARQTQGR